MTDDQVTEREPRPDKVAMVAEVRSRLDQAAAVILTEYRGLDVAAMAALRQALRAAGGDYKVYKNSMIRRAVADLQISDLDDLLIGPTALAFVRDDAAAVAKALRDFSRVNGALVIKGGVLGDIFVDEAQIRALADLPSREELLTRLAGGLQAPMQRFAGLLQGTIAKFAYALNALIEARGPEPDDAGEAPTADEATTSDEAPADEAPIPDDAPTEVAADDAPADEALPDDEAATPAAAEEAVASDET